MIKRNMVKTGDVLRWIGTQLDDECVMLFLEQISKYEKFAAWRVLNMSEGKYEIVEINSTNARLWEKLA